MAVNRRLSKRFFGVRGFMKSGTNWLGALLNLHPQVACLGEFHFHEIMQQVYQRIHSPLYYGSVPEKQKAIRFFEQALESCLVDAAPPEAELIGDRTPATLSPITLRGVPYLVILRDGRDVLVSRAFHLFNNPQVTRLFQRHADLQATLEHLQKNRWHLRDHPGDLLANEELVRSTVRAWRTHLESDRKTVERNQRLQVKFVRYEDLHSGLERILPSLFEFLDVDPQLARPRSAQEEPGIASESPRSFFRKGAAGDWRTYFQPQTRQWFEEEAGDELALNGFLELNSW